MIELIMFSESASAAVHALTLVIWNPSSMGAESETSNSVGSSQKLRR